MRMYKSSEFKRDNYKLRDVAAMLGVTIQTLHNYEKKGLLTFQRTKGGHRYITREDFLAYLEREGLLLDDKADDHSDRYDVVYAGSMMFDDYDDYDGPDDDNDVLAIFDVYSQDQMNKPEIISGSDYPLLIEQIMHGRVGNVYVRCKHQLTPRFIRYCRDNSVTIYSCDDRETVSNILSERLGMKSYTDSQVEIIADFLYHCMWHNLFECSVTNPAAIFARDAKSGKFKDDPEEEYKQKLNHVKDVSTLWRGAESASVLKLMENAFRYAPKEDAVKIIQDLVYTMLDPENWALKTNTTM